ncbi:MAG: hypothetical protein IT347_02190 [Candidatus Eisenbacteria bacterium]|nr:hypothetical protein [Candidatus Eisenbacteria bacterium]
MTPESATYSDASPAVQAHLSILQSVIQRMASNSTSCKAWCIGLVSAVLVVVADKGRPNYVWLAAIPTALFFVLDAYYLGLERGFRRSYNTFIDQLHHGQLRAADLYAVQPAGGIGLVGALFSFSVWPVYVTLLGMIFLAQRFLL